MFIFCADDQRVDGEGSCLIQDFASVTDWLFGLPDIDFPVIAVEGHGVYCCALRR